MLFIRSKGASTSSQFLGGKDAHKSTVRGKRAAAARARKAGGYAPVRTSATSKDCRSVKDDERHWKTPWASCQILKPDALRPPLIVHGPTSLSFEQAF